MTKRVSFLAVPALMACLMTSGCATDGWSSSQAEQASDKQMQMAQAADSTRPSLVVKDNNSTILYRPGSRDSYTDSVMPVAAPAETESSSYNGMSPDPEMASYRSQPAAKVVVAEPVIEDSWIDMSDNSVQELPIKHPRIDTLVGRKVQEMYQELQALQAEVNKHDSHLTNLQMQGDSIAGAYYSMTGELSARLQSGTTPGNPEMLDMWNSAGEQLDKLSAQSKDLSRLSNDIANTASKGAFLNDSTRATFGLSGAVEDDHTNLTALEDMVNQGIVRINRMLNVVNDEINRRNAYLRTERLNMQTMSVAIANGELYGQSMSSRLFSRVADTADERDPAASFNAAPVPSKRPLVIIRFDRPNVQYQQPLYTALSQAMEKYPGAQFDVVAVSPASRNPAEQALSSSDARRNSENVLRTMTQMGVPTNRISMGSETRPNIGASEVHLYIR